MLFILPGITAAQTLQLRPLKKAPSKPVLYELNMRVNRDISSVATIEIQFPAHFDLSAVKIAGSNAIKGGIRFSVDSTTVVLQRTGLGPTVPAGQSVSLIFGPVVQKSSPTNVDSVWVRIFFEGVQKRSNYQAFKIGIR
ncbi:MAG: hypothetical protein Q9P90_10315 [candidate division KSB1 bacterium]|nr:hypothetical protein [candidate division KSB1 bacterium]